MTNPDERPTPSHAERRTSPWIAFRYRAFMVVWIATVVANVGTWMYNAASGWLMTSLNPDPLTVSLVQVAGSLPMFLFALPAGALADTIDKRRFLIGAEIVLTVVAAASAVLVWLDLVTPSILCCSHSCSAPVRHSPPQHGSPSCLSLSRSPTWPRR
jgi:MFS family permease